jgi:3-hydroxyacyl-CoA dehydrogenase
MGPLTLADFIGLDTCLEITRVLFEGTGDPKFRPDSQFVIVPVMCQNSVTMSRVNNRSG